jgi:flavin-dependent dehydrogenase
MKGRVAVVGAGTSGLLTARRLNELSVDAVVYEQRVRPGYPVSASGILSIGGLSTLGIGYRGAVTNTLYGARLHMGRETIEVRSRRAVARVLDRSKLNEICYEECERSGVEIKVGRRVDATLLGELSKDRIIVGADGVVSTVARHFDFPPISRHILTYRVEYEHGSLDDNRAVELFFDNSVTPGFFGWVSPVSEVVCEAGVGIDSRKGNSKKAFEGFVKLDSVRKLIGKGRIINEGAGVIPVGLRRHFVDEKREVLLVGDAAGQVKPTTGGGVIFGGNGALLAANAIHDYINQNGQLIDYEKRWRREFEKEIRLHSFLHTLYASLDKKQLERIAGILKATRFDRFLDRYGDMDRPSVMIKRFFFRDMLE